MKRKLLTGAAILSGLLVLSVFFVKADVTQTGIETSRLATVQSLVDDGTFDVTHSIFKTPDKACLNGKYYGDKPPLLTFLTAGEYFLLSRWAGLTFRTHYHAVIFLLNLPYFLISASLMILFYAGLKRYAGRIVPDRTLVLFALLSFFSTLVFSYSVTLGNHSICAVLLMALLLQLQAAEKRRWPLMHAFWCGVTCGVLFNCEFVEGGAFGLGVFCLILTAKAPDAKIRFRRILAYGAGAGLLIACEGIMNFVSYRSVLPLYLLTHHPDMAHKDYLCYAWNALFGFEGFFLYVPACLFLFPALLRRFPGKDRVCACMLSSALLTTLLFLAGTSDYGGFCYGFRFLIPLAPVLLFYAFLSFCIKRKGAFCKGLFALALAWGVLTAFFGTMDPWNGGYEGSLTAPGNFNEQVRNGFLGNVFVYSFERAPDSAMTAFFVDRVYGPRIAYLYLCEEFLNRRQADRLQDVNAWFRNNRPRPGQ